VIAVIPVEDFIKKLQCEKDSSAIIIACSGGKRSDTEIGFLKNMPAVLDLKQTSINFDNTTMELLRSFRICTEKEHPDAIKPSKDYPAFLRYSGQFYRAVWECGKTQTWEKVVQENWKILILSAYYGFLKITDPIKNYNLQMSKLKAKCKRMLPQVLQAIKNANDIENIYFFASNTYTHPFKGELENIYQVYLLDHLKKEIYGQYAREYYKEAGYLFASIISGDVRGSARFVSLEVV